MSFVAFEPDENRRATDPAIDIIVHKVTRMATDMDKMAESVGKLSESMGRMVLVEERIGNMMLNLERIHRRLDEGDKRMQALELATIDASKASKWVDRGLVGVLSALAVYVGHKLGLM